MRKMYSEKQIEELAQKKVEEMIKSGEIKQGFKFTEIYNETINPSSNNEIELSQTIVEKILDAKNIYVEIDFDEDGDNMFAYGHIICPFKLTHLWNVAITMSRFGGIDTEVLDPICINIAEIFS